MQAPKVDVLIDDGSRVPLASFYASQAVALVFLRHLGCIFCREHVAELTSRPELSVALVSMATPEEAADFRREVLTRHPIICDPNRSLHEVFGLTRGTTSQIFNFKTLSRGYRAYRAGHRQGKAIGDPFQLPGAFVIDTEGEILWEYRGKDASDNPSAATIHEALEAVGQRKLSASG